MDISFHKASAVQITPVAVARLGDSKTKASAVECLIRICEATDPGFCITQLLSVIDTLKNPKSISETLIMASVIVDDFGVQYRVTI